jgi:hypothetical protein
MVNYPGMGDQSLLPRLTTSNYFMVSAVVGKRGGREEARDRGGGVHARGEQDFGGSLMDKV